MAPPPEEGTSRGETMKHTMGMHVCVLAMGLVGVGCAARDRSTSDPDGPGVLRAQLSRVPDDVHCLRITSRGARTTQQVFPLTPGTEPVNLDTRLPVGPQTVTGEAFEGSC